MDMKLLIVTAHTTKPEVLVAGIDHAAKAYKASPGIETGQNLDVACHMWLSNRHSNYVGLDQALQEAAAIPVFTKS